MFALIGYYGDIMKQETRTNRPPKPMKKQKLLKPKLSKYKPPSEETNKRPTKMDTHPRGGSLR